MPDKQKDTWTRVDRYFTEALIHPDRGLDAALEANRDSDLPAIDVTALQGRFLEILVSVSGARRVLEIGTLGGYSTIWLARSLPHGGVVVTLEIEPKHAAIARKNIATAGFADRVDLRVAPAAESLAALAAEPVAPFDLVFIDADKAGYPEYLKWALRLSRPGSLIIADNVVRDGKVTDAESPDPNIQGVRRFTEMVSAESRLRGTVLQTVGSKGYDGFAMALVLD